MSVLIHIGDEALSRLEQLGLKDEWFRRALLRGDAESRTVSPLAPKGFEGTTRWGRSAEFLREELCANRWLPDDFQNIARSVHPAGEFCIVVTTGGVGTGREEAHPFTKYPKGSGIAACVESNYVIDFDPEDLAKLGIPPTVKDSVITWFLLFTVEDNQIWSELSLPEAISADGQIISWVERILFPPIDLGPNEPVSGGFTKPMDPVDVPVSRR
ncbi:MAG: hypothetical protein ACRDTH_23255 [Pseudonocardiaceae bacterium]